MGGRYKEMTPQRIANQIDEGRGQGEGKEFTPWFEATEFPTRGRMVRAKSLVTGRVMHMVSEIEGAYLHLIDFTPGVVDIREQSLCDFEMTVDIARRLRVRHPRAWEGHLVPMTTDFLVTFDDAWGRRELALSVKSEGELRGRKKARVFQKLAIEQLYHVAKGRSFLLVTDAGINPRVMSNLALLGEAFRSGSSEISDAEQSAFERAFPRHEKDGSTIRERIDVAALASGLPSQKAIDAFRRAVWSRRILIDLRQWIRLNSEFVPTTDVNLGVELPWSR